MMNKTIGSLTDKFNSYRYAKHISVAVLLLLLFFTYEIYVWAKTQSTDNAYVEADISSISSEVNGVIDKVLVKENNIVEANQIIAKIKDDDHKANFNKAEAALDGARRDIEIIEQDIKLSNIEQQKTDEAYQFAVESFRISEIDYKRIQSLSKDNFASKKNVDSTKILFEKAKSDLVQAEFNMQTSKENLTLLEIKRFASIAKYNTSSAELDLAKRALDNTVIRSPIRGMIGNSSLREGNYIRAGSVLFSVVPIDELYIKANFKETQISKFKLGMKVEILVDSEKGEKIEGEIRNVSPATGAKFSLLPPSNATGNFTKIVQRVPVIIDFQVPERVKNKIVPGMSVFVKVRT